MGCEGEGGGGGGMECRLYNDGCEYSLTPVPVLPSC